METARTAGPFGHLRTDGVGRLFVMLNVYFDDTPPDQVPADVYSPDGDRIAAGVDVALGADVVDDGDVGVVEGSGCADFLFEASEPLRVTGVLLLCPELDTARLVRRSASPERTLDYDGASRPTSTESYLPRVMFG